jgi:hypothetical protein
MGFCKRIMTCKRLPSCGQQQFLVKSHFLFLIFFKGFPCTAGTTSTCAFIRNGKLYTGHVGDSSIILANFAEAAVGCKQFMYIINF